MRDRVQLIRERVRLRDQRWHLVVELLQYKADLGRGILGAVHAIGGEFSRCVLELIERGTDDRVGDFAGVDKGDSGLLRRGRQHSAVAGPPWPSMPRRQASDQ